MKSNQRDTRIPQYHKNYFLLAEINPIILDLNHTNSLTTHTKMYKQRQPTVNNIDVQLIREFALRPIIYNKATPYFKNKYLTDSAWDEIASKVGGDGESYPFN